MIIGYGNRPNSTSMNGKFAAVSIVCFAEFATYYHKDYHSRKETDIDGDNDCQPEVLTEDVMESEPSSDGKCRSSFPSYYSAHV